MSTSRIVIGAATAALALAACGSEQKPAPVDPGGPSGGGGGERVMAPGTSGLPGLDWGASADEVLALYPRGTAVDTGVEYLGTVEGHLAIERFTIGADGLERVDIEWTEGLISMEDCLKVWAELRTELDGSLGASQSDNGAAYWDLPAASVTLACNPNDSEAGVLSQTHTKPE
jgi:hypothetical protein